MLLAQRGWMTEGSRPKLNRLLRSRLHGLLLSSILLMLQWVPVAEGVAGRMLLVLLGWTTKASWRKRYRLLRHSRLQK